MAERMAIVVAEGAFCGGADMGEYEWRRGLGRNTLKVNAVPRRNRRSEDAWLWT